MNVKRLTLFILVVAVTMGATAAWAEMKFGPRIPTAYFATTGTGQSDQGIEPDPYETFSYDLALREAGIENFNVMYYTSVLPPESYEVDIKDVAPFIHHGSVLEAIMAKAGGEQYDTVATGIGRVLAADSSGKFIGGFAAEYERIYEKQKVGEQQAYEDAKAQLTRSLQHELTIRGLKQVGEMAFNITSLYITKKYGMCLSALGFVNFIYPGPLPLDKKE